MPALERCESYRFITSIRALIATMTVLAAISAATRIMSAVSTVTLEPGGLPLLM